MYGFLNIRKAKAFKIYGIANAFQIYGLPKLLKYAGWSGGSGPRALVGLPRGSRVEKQTGL